MSWTSLGESVREGRRVSTGYENCD